MNNQVKYVDSFLDLVLGFRLISSRGAKSKILYYLILKFSC